MRKVLFSGVLFLLFSFLLLNISKANGYEIDITINGLSDSDVILGHYVNQSMYPDDTIKVDKSGHGIFKGPNALDQGMYIIYFSGSILFDIMVGSDQEFSLEADTSDIMGTVAFKGSDDNEIFFGFKKFMDDVNKQVEEAKKKYGNSDKQKDKEKLKEALNSVDEKRKQEINHLKAERPDLWVTTFLVATLDIEVPDAPKDENGNLIDSNWSYHYYRRHYFDNFDISDPRLLRTPLYEGKVMKYLEKVVPQIPDTLIKEVDYIIEQTEHDSDLFRFTLITLFNHYGQSKLMGMEGIQVHIAEKYYIERSWWSAPKYIEDLKERVESMKPTLIGNIAPNIQLRYVPSEHFKEAATNDSLRSYPHAGAFFHLQDIKAEYTVLVFWEPNCSHCKKAVPKLIKIFNDTLKEQGVKIIAINTLSGIEGKEKWTDFVNKHKLYDWINAWNPYDYQYKLTYDIRSTPQIFILDDKKEIIAKRIGEDQVAEIIALHKKIKAKENKK